MATIKERWDVVKDLQRQHLDQRQKINAIPVNSKEFREARIRLQDLEKQVKAARKKASAEDLIDLQAMANIGFFSSEFN